MNGKAIDIIQRARQNLGFIKKSLDDLAKNPHDAQLKQTSFANIVVWGRTVTFVLQNLRSAVGQEFDEWYQPFVEEMKKDQLLVEFKDARNDLEKQGKLNLQGGL
jgi:hypothetical protein